MNNNESSQTNSQDTYDEVGSVQREFGLILVGAFIFTASFLWKDVLSEIEELYFPKSDGILGRIGYTFIVTVLIVLVAVRLKWFFGLRDEDTKGITTDDIPVVADHKEHRNESNHYY